MYVGKSGQFTDSLTESVFQHKIDIMCLSHILWVNGQRVALCFFLQGFFFFMSRFGEWLQLFYRPIHGFCLFVCSRVLFILRYYKPVVVRQWTIVKLVEIALLNNNLLLFIQNETSLGQYMAKIIHVSIRFLLSREIVHYHICYAQQIHCKTIYRKDRGGWSRSVM